MCYIRKLAIEYRTRKGEWGAESGSRRTAPVVLPARGLVLFVVKPGTPTRSHTYSARHTHLFTLSSAENRRTRTPTVRSGDKCRVPCPQPWGGAPPARYLRQPPHNTNPAHDADVTLHRARGDNHTRIPHRHMDPTLFHTRLLYN